MNPNFLKNTGSKKMRRILNGQITKHGKKNMGIEVFFFRLVAVCLIIGLGLIWASQRWDNFSCEVGTYFFLMAFGFSVGGVLITIYDLGKWIFNFFKG